MSTETNKEFVRRYLGAINGKVKTRELIEAYVSDAELTQHILASEASFPKYRIDIEDMIGEGDLVTVRGTVHAVNAGPLKGMPPTNREVSFAIFITYRIHNGRIVEHWMLTDNLELMTQLGVVPVPDQPAANR